MSLGEVTAVGYFYFSENADGRLSHEGCWNGAGVCRVLMITCWVDTTYTRGHDEEGWSLARPQQAQDLAVRKRKDSI